MAKWKLSLTIKEVKKIFFLLWKLGQAVVDFSATAFCYYSCLFIPCNPIQCDANIVLLRLQFLQKLDGVSNKIDQSR